jgi:hypothetical protein
MLESKDGGIDDRSEELNDHNLDEDDVSAIGPKALKKLDRYC